MLIYNYNPIDGTFTGMVRANESPLEAGVYLVPAYATDKKPMAPKGVKRPVFNGEEWSLIEDYRGETIYSKENGQPIIVEKLGPIPSGYTKEARPNGDYSFDSVTKKWAFDEVKYHARLVRESLSKRAKLLQETDWSQLPDVKEDTKNKYLPYRQALRDITEQPGYPLYIQWPAIP